MATNRYITDSDRLIVYRHPIARAHSEKILMLLKDLWDEIHDRTKTKEDIGIKLYHAIEDIFGKNNNILISDDIDNLTNYKLSDTRKIK